MIELQKNKLNTTSTQGPVDDWGKILQPGWCWEGHLAKIAAIGGIKHSSLQKSVLKACEKLVGSKLDVAGKRHVEWYD